MSHNKTQCKKYFTRTILHPTNPTVFGFLPVGFVVVFWVGKGAYYKLRFGKMDQLFHQ